MTLDEDLLEKVGRVVENLGTTRSHYIRESLHYYLKKSKTEELEKKHFKGYSKNPVKKDEFDNWEEEQVWD